MIAENFWSFDYATGVEALMSALNLSMAENKQFLAMVQERAKIEHATASSLAQLSQKPAMHSVPVQKDAYMPKSSSLQSAINVFTTETVSQAVAHTRIASDLDTRVRLPLQKWCDGYAKRVASHGTTLRKLVARYKELSNSVNKQRIAYYEQCHRLEDSAGGSPRDPLIKTIRLLKEHLAPDEVSRRGNETRDEGSYTLAGLNYTSQELADLLSLILQDVTLSEYRVPLLGSYQNVTSGSRIGTSTRKHVKNDSFAYAEKFGQSLVDQGFLKPVGQISNKFQSTHTSHYQFQPQAFDLLQRGSAVAEERRSPSPSPKAPLPTPQTPRGQTPRDLTPPRTLQDMATDPSEEYYLQAVLELDVFRCDMELEIMEIYESLDALEQEREEAIQRAMEEFVKVAFRPDEMRRMQTRMHDAQSQIDPAADLRALVSKNQTGPFIPTVTVFHGYANGSYVQTFGVDLPFSKFLVDIVLDWLPTLPDKDTQSLLLWTKPEPIREVYKLRAQINTGKPFSPDAIFRFFSLNVVVSTLRQYLLELPESVVSFMIYERIKSLYSQSARDSIVERDDMFESATAAPNEIATVLIQIPPVNRQVLKRFIMYLRHRFPTSTYAELASSLALPLIRPRAPSAVNMNDTHAEELLLDLLILGPEVFHSLDIKQKEMDASKDNKHMRFPVRIASRSPTAARSPDLNAGVLPAVSPRLTSTPTSAPATSTATSSPQQSSSPGPTLGSGSTLTPSTSSGLRPLSLSQDSRLSSFSNHKRLSSISGQSKRSGSSDSPGHNPIVPLPFTPGRPQASRSSSGIAMPRLRPPKNE